MAVTITRSRWVRNAASNLSTSAGASTLGRVRGALTRGTVRDLCAPPCRLVASPRGTGLALTAVSPLATKYEERPDTVTVV